MAMVDVNRRSPSLHNEKGDVEKVEEIQSSPSDGSLSPPADTVAMTWKTWVVIFVSALLSDST